MSFWMLFFLIQLGASVYAFLREPKQDGRWGAYAVTKAAK